MSTAVLGPASTVINCPAFAWSGAPKTGQATNSAHLLAVTGCSSMNGRAIYKQLSFDIAFDCSGDKPLDILIGSDTDEYDICLRKGFFRARGYCSTRQTLAEILSLGDGPVPDD